MGFVKINLNSMELDVQTHLSVPVNIVKEEIILKVRLVTELVKNLWSYLQQILD